MCQLLQQNLSRWLWGARNLPLMESEELAACEWTVEQHDNRPMLTGLTHDLIVAMPF